MYLTQQGQRSQKSASKPSRFLCQGSRLALHFLLA